SGVTVVAKLDETARELRRIWEDRQVEKDYLALVHGHVREATGVIDAPLGKDERSRVAIKDCVREDGAAARTEFWVEKRFMADGSRRQPSLSLSSLRMGGEGWGEEGRLSFPSEFPQLSTHNYQPLS